MRWLEDLRHDVVHSLRALGRAPAFAAAAVGTLALGIGATSAIFSVTHALLVKSLPYAHESERLVRLVASTPNPVDAAAPPRRVPVMFSVAEALDLDAHGQLFDGTGVWSPTVVGLPGIENAGHLGAARISASALALLDARPVLGRVIEPADEAGDRGVALLSYAAWQRYFGGAADILGRRLTVQNVLGPRTSRVVDVVGVMPPSFAFPAADTEIWVTLDRPPAGGAAARGLLLARLAANVDPTRALDAIAGGVRAARNHGSEVRYELMSEQDQLVGPVRPAVLVLAAVVTVLLLIACLNVANLLLARTFSRSRELSVRAAMGATRGRLARQCLTESTIIGVLGGVGALGLAAWGLTAFRSLATSLPRIDLATTGAGWGSATFPRLGEVTLDGTVLAFTAAASVAAGLVAGLAAALRASRAEVAGVGRVSGATARSSAPGTGAVRRGLVVMQVAGATTLLVGAALLTRSLQHLVATDPGYDAEDVLTFQVVLPSAAYPDARLQSFAETVAERLRAVPGVVAAAYANQLPMVQLRDTAGGLWTTPDATRRGAPDSADARFVSRDYFAVMGIRVLAGRGFEARDGTGQPRVLVVNQALARRQFPDRNPVGLQVYVGRDVAPWTVVGVVSDVRQFGLDRAPEPQFFADLRQWTGGMPLFPTGAYYVVKTRGIPDVVVPDVRALIRAIDGDAALFNVARMETIVAATVARPRLYATLVGAFAALGALLAAIGVYGVLAFAVHERTAEIGVRMALGASRRDVIGMVLRQGGGPVLAGIVLGGLGAAGLGRALESLLYGVRPIDPWSFAAAAALFGVVAAMAILLPTRRATRVDPMVALRCE